MITLKIENTRSCKLTKNEEVRKGDNNISAFSIVFPSNFGAGHPRAECAVEMRCYLPNGEFLSYELDTSQPTATQPITYDLTEQEQQIGIMFIITHGVEVIGKTNTETLYVYDAPDSDREPLTPREDCDRVINEQRQTIASQAATIDEQSERIKQDSATIGSLNTQVGELTTENTRLEALTETQRKTIQNMIDNPPEPRLETPDIIAPEAETRQYTPSTGYDGFASFTVKGTSLINPELNAYFKREEPIDLTFDQRVVFDYMCYGNNAIRSINFSENVYQIGANSFAMCTGVSEINFSVGLIVIFNNAFSGCSNLIRIILPHGLRRIAGRAFNGCTNLTTMFFPNSLVSSNEVTMLIGCSKLQNVTLENGFNSNGLHLEYSILYTAETIVSWLEALADRTGQTAYTLTIGATNLNQLTTEQKAIAIGKNWNLA